MHCQDDLWLMIAFACCTAAAISEWSSVFCGNPRQIWLEPADILASAERPAPNSQLGKKFPGSLVAICDSIRHAVNCNISRFLALIRKQSIRRLCCIRYSDPVIGLWLGFARDVSAHGASHIGVIVARRCDSDDRLFPTRTQKGRRSAILV